MIRYNNPYMPETDEWHKYEEDAFMAEQQQITQGQPLKPFYTLDEVEVTDNGLRLSLPQPQPMRQTHPVQMRVVSDDPSFRQAVDSYIAQMDNRVIQTADDYYVQQAPAPAPVVDDVATQVPASDPVGEYLDRLAFLDEYEQGPYTKEQFIAERIEEGKAKMQAEKPLSFKVIEDTNPDIVDIANVDRLLNEADKAHKMSIAKEQGMTADPTYWEGASVDSLTDKHIRSYTQYRLDSDPTISPTKVLRGLKQELGSKYQASSADLMTIRRYIDNPVEQYTGSLPLNMPRDIAEGVLQSGLGLVQAVADIGSLIPGGADDKAVSGRIDLDAADKAYENRKLNFEAADRAYERDLTLQPLTEEELDAMMREARQKAEPDESWIEKQIRESHERVEARGGGAEAGATIGSTGALMLGGLASAALKAPLALAGTFGSSYAYERGQQEGVGSSLMGATIDTALFKVGDKIANWLTKDSPRELAEVTFDHLPAGIQKEIRNLSQAYGKNANDIFDDAVSYLKMGKRPYAQPEDILQTGARMSAPTDVVAQTTKEAGEGAAYKLALEGFGRTDAMAGYGQLDDALDSYRYSLGGVDDMVDFKQAYEDFIYARRAIQAGEETDHLLQLEQKSPGLVQLIVDNELIDREGGRVVRTLTDNKIGPQRATEVIELADGTRLPEVTAINNLDEVEETLRILAQFDDVNLAAQMLKETPIQSTARREWSASEAYGMNAKGVPTDWVDRPEVKAAQYVPKYGLLVRAYRHLAGNLDKVQADRAYKHVLNDVARGKMVLEPGRLDEQLTRYIGQYQDLGAARQVAEAVPTKGGGYSPGGKQVTGKALGAGMTAYVDQEKVKDETKLYYDQAKGMTHGY